MLLSIIIINYNTFDLSCAAIRSVQQWVPGSWYEIVLVDNASPDDRTAQFRALFPEVKVIRSEENGGFAKGNNLGIRHAEGRYILLLNSDAYLTEDCLTPAVAQLEARPELGVLSVRTNYPDGRYQRNARRFRSISWELLDALRLFPMLLPYSQRARLMLGKYFKGDFDTTCDWLSGAFFMFKKEHLQRLPGQQLDERFFMYGEDQLWCVQFKEAGFTNYFLSGPSVVHISNASTERAKQLRLLNVMRQHELAIMRYRKGNGLYYLLFKLVFLPKQYLMYAMKYLKGAIR
jgi:GT2 family glycosyltransferase